MTALPSPAALGLAQAYWFLALLDDGVVKNQAELARLCGFSRMRVRQIMALLDLPARTQARLLEHHVDSLGGPSWCGRQFDRVVRRGLGSGCFTKL